MSDPHRIHWDGTINVPTILTLLGMIAASIGAGIAMYTNLSDRIQTNASDIVLLKSQVAEAKQASDQQRNDVKSDLARINDKLDKLLWDRGDRANPKLREWTK